MEVRMPRKSKKSPKAPPDPRDLAAKAVSAWFDAVTTRLAAHSHGSVYAPPDLLTAAEDIKKTLFAYEAAHGLKVTSYDEAYKQLAHEVIDYPPVSRFLERLDEAACHDSMGAMEVGYLIGVEVGMRLNGGAR